ncbi:MAG: hypothetical protein KBD62_37320 [Kofleriaceae bacterium]|nr:hypothetical protein [Kofleriaceae bacterium]
MSRNDPTRQELIAASFLRAYYDGKHDAARSRMGIDDPVGLDNLPDDTDVDRVLFEEDDDATNELRHRAMVLADSLMLSLEIKP